jgi:dTDP-4-dehydrorhamnose 3,5-epimerase
MLEGAVKDKGHVSPNWDFKYDLIDGVRMKDVRNIVTKNGITRELYRPDWRTADDKKVVDGTVQHMIFVSLRGHAISAWHMHEIQTDHIYPINGLGKLVLFDGREGSKTKGKVNQFNVSPMRPTLFVIPPGVWHGLQNMDTPEFQFINFFDRPYEYDKPDEWRLNWNTDKIPYKFERQF